MIAVGGGLLKRLMGNEADAVHEPTMPIESATHGNDQVLSLRLKKKYQLGMLKQMLEEGGYGDLAKMTNITKRDYDEEY